MKTIYIDLDEEITSVIDRIRKIRDREIALVIPQRALLTQSLVNLRLLKNQSEILSREIIIVTADQVGKHLATRAGLSVREKIGKEAAADLEMESSRPLPVAVRRDNSQAPAVNHFMPLARSSAVSVSDIIRRAKSQKFYPLERPKSGRKKWFKIPFFGKKVKAKKRPGSRPKRKSARKATRLSSFSAKLGLGFIGFSVFLILLIIFLILPKAIVEVVPKSEPFSENVNIIVKADLPQNDSSLNAIPGKIIVLEKQETGIFKATGKREAGAKAQGEVTLYNESGVAQPLVQTTRLMAPGNILFRTQSDAAVPARSVSEDGKVIPGSVKVKVMADLAGPEGNIGPADFYIVAFAPSRRAQIYAKSDANMTGGAIGAAGIVSEKDLEDAKNETFESLVSASREEILNNLPAGFSLLDGALASEIIEIKNSKAAGEEADTFETTVKVQVKAFIFSLEEARNVALQAAGNLLAGNKYILDPSDQGVSCKLENVDFNEKKALATLHLEKEAFWKIDPAALQEAIAGKNEKDGLTYLQSVDAISEARLRFWPFWVTRAPSLEKKIEVKIVRVLP